MINKSNLGSYIDLSVNAKQNGGPEEFIGGIKDESFKEGLVTGIIKTAASVMVLFLPLLYNKAKPHCINAYNKIFNKKQINIENYEKR